MPVTPGLFRTHVAQRPQNIAGDRGRRFALQARQTEIGEPHVLLDDPAADWPA